MESLLVLKERFKNIYSKHEVYITPILKFIMSFIIFMQVNEKLGYMSKINNLAIVLVMALMCSFLPYNFIVFIAAAFVVAHLYALSFECAIVALCVFLLLFLLYFRFSPKDTIVVLLTPLCFMLRIPYVMPLAMGLVGTPASIVSVGSGVIVYYLINYISSNVTAITLLGENGTVAKFRYIIDGVLNNKLMLVVILGFAITITIVYFIRRLSIDHAWTIAMVAGALSNIVILLVGDLMFDTKISIMGTLTGTIFSIGIVKILQFFVFNVDYSRTEMVQFEDDEYYYYVKAVPKITVSVPDKTIKKINSQNEDSFTNSRILANTGATSNARMNQPNPSSRTSTRTVTRAGNNLESARPNTVGQRPNTVGQRPGSPGQQSTSRVSTGYTEGIERTSNSRDIGQHE
ncbi:MAG TPA: hypothetical protein VJZ04_10965 [Lachnospiraceae bacterium]|nr:hypothetical protein [Lachnospiraceae bacterium]